MQLQLWDCDFYAVAALTSRGIEKLKVYERKEKRIENLKKFILWNNLVMNASGSDWIFTSELLAWLFYWGKNQNATECRSHRIGISIESLFLNQAIFRDIMLEKVKVRKLPDHEYFIYLICKRSPRAPAEELCTDDIKS